MDKKANEMLKKWCSDCKHKGNTILADPCHNCFEDFAKNHYEPKYYQQESRHIENDGNIIYIELKDDTKTIRQKVLQTASKKYGTMYIRIENHEETYVLLDFLRMHPDKRCFDLWLGSIEGEMLCDHVTATRIASVIHERIH